MRGTPPAWRSCKPGVGGSPPGNFQKSPVTTGDTGDTPGWRDTKHWFGRLRTAATLADLKRTVVEWATAAGGVLGIEGGRQVLHLPRLERCAVVNRFYAEAGHIGLPIRDLAPAAAVH